MSLLFAFPRGWYHWSHENFCVCLFPPTSHDYSQGHQSRPVLVMQKSLRFRNTKLLAYHFFSFVSPINYTKSLLARLFMGETMGIRRFWHVITGNNGFLTFHFPRYLYFLPFDTAFSCTLHSGYRPIPQQSEVGGAKAGERLPVFTYWLPTVAPWKKVRSGWVRAGGPSCVFASITNWYPCQNKQRMWDGGSTFAHIPNWRPAHFCRSSYQLF